MSETANHYNPARDEPEDTRPFACLWELLRRNWQFRLDARTWLESWDECEKLLGVWTQMSDREKQGKRAKRNEDQRVRLRSHLFMLKHGEVHVIDREPPKLDQPKVPTVVPPGQDEPCAARAWERAGYVTCALSWLLPPTERQVSPSSTDAAGRPVLGHACQPEEYRPELTREQLKENRPFGPLRLNMTWPQTPPGFRTRFIREATPGWEGDKVELFDLHALALRLIHIGNVIPRAKDGAKGLPPRSPQELEQAKDDLYAIALDELAMMHDRFKCFIIPSGVVYPRSQFKQNITEIEKHFKIRPDGLYPKASLLGRENQWEAFLTAEALPRKDGQLDHHETARSIAASRDGDKPENIKSRLASKNESDIKDRCDAITHWIRCVYPQFKPEPFVGRKGRKTVPENS